MHRHALLTCLLLAPAAALTGCRGGGTDHPAGPPQTTAQQIQQIDADPHMPPAAKAAAKAAIQQGAASGAAAARQAPPGPR